MAGANVQRVGLRRRPDSLLLALFDEAGRNAHVTSGLLRELLGVFPEPSELGADEQRVEGIAPGPDGHTLYVVDEDGKVDMRFLVVD